MRVTKCTPAELTALARSPFARDELVDPAGSVVVLSAGGDEESGTAASLGVLPCVVVAGDGCSAGAAELADVVLEEGIATVDDVLQVVDANPIAATALALLLREPARSLGAGLAAESAVYSALQSGPEFARWRASRPVRVRPPRTAPAVLIERRDDQLDVVIDRPEVRNALDTRVRDGLLEGLALAAADPSLLVVVLRGNGPSFCSGGDLDEFGSFDDPSSAHLVRLSTSVGWAIDQLGMRVRVEVHGPCAGSGVELPAFAPRVLARPDFTASLPEVQLGLIPGAGGTVSVVRRIGRHRAALLALSGAHIDADVALRWGLVDEIA